jgi:hypothetical protein
MDIRKLPKKNKKRKSKEIIKDKEIEALEYIKTVLIVWDKHNKLNLKEDKC